MAGESGAIRVTSKMEGLDDLLKKFRRLRGEFKQDNATSPINKALMAAGLPIQKDAKSRAMRFDDPETETSIADNIVRSRIKKPSEMFEVGVMVRTRKKDDPRGTPYWHFVEFGTAKQGAQPFMRPAGMAKRGEAMALFKKRLARAITLAAKK